MTSSEGVRPFGEQDAVLHIAIRRDENQQDAFFRQADEFDLLDAWCSPARRDDNAGKVRETGKQVGCAADQLLWLQGLQLIFDFPHTRPFQRTDGEQAVDKEAVAACGGYATGRGVRAGNEAGFFKVGHDIAYGGGRQVESGEFGQGTRADRLSLGDVPFDQCFEQDAGAFV